MGREVALEMAQEEEGGVMGEGHSRRRRDVVVEGAAMCLVDLRLQFGVEGRAARERGARVLGVVREVEGELVARLEPLGDRDHHLRVRVWVWGVWVGVGGEGTRVINVCVVIRPQCVW